MKRSFFKGALLLFAGLVQCSPTRGQNPPSSGEPRREPTATKAGNSKKVITNDDLPGQQDCSALAQTAKDAANEDPVAAAFLHRIAGRWNFAYSRKGNQSWWPDHGSAKPKNEIHYLFGPRVLLIESRREFALPSVTGCFVYGSIRKVSDELFDIALRKPSEASGEMKRFKLSSDKKTLEMAADAEGDPQPTIQVLEFVDSNWSPGAARP